MITVDYYNINGTPEQKKFVTDSDYKYWRNIYDYLTIVKIRVGQVITYKL
jgi:hypothetical protein